MADAERISQSYVSRILRLTLLAPDIVERILDGRPTAGLPELMKPFPVEWEKQRTAIKLSKCLRLRPAESCLTRQD